MATILSTAEIREILNSGFRYACTLTGSPQDAEDLVQESWLKLLSAYADSPSRALLFRAIRNAHIDRVRRDQRYQHLPIDESAYSAPDDSFQTHEFDVSDQQLSQALHRLKEQEREVLFLLVVEGYTAQEVAELTGKSRGTILSLSHRGKTKLRTYLAEMTFQADFEPTNKQGGGHD